MIIYLLWCQVNANSVAVLHSLCNIMYTKLANVENMLNQPTQVASTKANMTPNNKQSTPSPAKAHPRKDVFTPQYNHSRSLPGSNVKNIEVVDLSKYEDEHAALGMNKNETKATVGRRLPFTASPTTMPFKIPKTEPIYDDKTTKKGPNKHFTPLTNMVGISFNRPTLVGSGSGKPFEQLLTKVNMSQFRFTHFLIFLLIHLSCSMLIVCEDKFSSNTWNGFESWETTCL